MTLKSFFSYLTLYFSLYLSVKANTYCNTCSFPRVLGGTQGDTFFKAIDYDTNENILIGGISYDTSLVGSMNTLNSFKPFIGYLSACEYKWLYSYDNLKGYDLNIAKINDDGTLAAFSTEVYSN